ncbi:TetR/AcrR family transcriptional regulator [Amycolatopsis sp. NPDC059027]|uniref:TetR/AcrR family transcriptional regulator n=1 Tax=unclassified Amycolatopsis TaxID=2618356 RepID=UPI0036707B03
MPKPSARERILDAYEQVVIDQGPGVATLEGVAAQAGVSKGGLLYHFGSKDALVDGLLERLARLNEEDLELARQAPEGVVRYYLRSTITDVAENVPLNRTMTAAILLLSTEPRVSETLRRCSAAVREVMVAEVDDPLTAELVVLVGDGLWLRAAMEGKESPILGQVDAIISRIEAQI